jgi:hypothetical protein
MREIVVDSDNFPQTHERWRHEAESYERRWKSRGHLVIRIVIDPEAFLRWCTAASVEAE